MSDRIQAFEFARYNTGRADLLIFLKHRGFANLPIIKGSNLCEPSAFAHKVIERRSLFFYVQKYILWLVFDLILIYKSNIIKAMNI